MLIMKCHNSHKHSQRPLTILQVAFVLKNYFSLDYICNIFYYIDSEINNLIENMPTIIVSKQCSTRNTGKAKHSVQKSERLTLFVSVGVY